MRTLGGHLRQVPHLPSLEALSQTEGAELQPNEVDVVVNAAGLGSRDLVPDPDVAPIRGQILRVEAPWVKQAYFFDPFYIIPNRYGEVCA